MVVEIDRRERFDYEIHRALSDLPPEAAILAVYGLVHLVLLLAKEVAAQVKALLPTLGVK